MTDWHGVIEAFADGESVEADALKDALALAEGRDHLVDVLFVRQLAGGQGATRPIVISPTRKAGARWGWIAAAAAIVLSVAGGYAVGRRASNDTTPAPTTEGQMVMTPAPTPTRVIQLENGVDWSERGGGN